MRQVNRIIIHCSATKRSQDISAATVRSWHMSKNPPWSDIGYHWYIRKGGKLEAGRPIEKAGAHCKGHNHDSIGICLEGGLAEDGTPENNFDAEQFNTLRLITDGMKFKFNILSKNIKGHRDYSPDKNSDGVITKNEWLKVCPCFDVGDWYNERSKQTESRKHEMAQPSKNGVDKLQHAVIDNSSDSVETTKRSKSKRKPSRSTTSSSVG